MVKNSSTKKLLKIIVAGVLLSTVLALVARGTGWLEGMNP